MENFKFFGGRLGCFYFSLTLFLLLRYANGSENKTWPTANVNLGPIQQWRSAYFCLKYWAPNPDKCKPEHVITPTGRLNVSQEDLSLYCSPENCLDHTRSVLRCIHLVMNSGFSFLNNATIEYVNNTITNACANQAGSGGIHIGNLPKSSTGIKIYQMAYMSLVSGLLVFLAILNM